MAMMLMRQWHLAVLRVQLDVTQREPAVVTDLVSYAQEPPDVLWTRRNSLADFGLPQSGGPPGELRMPADLRDAIGSALRDDLRGESSLWLRLMPPYGHLGAVPWEQSLLGLTDVPLLRVPDRLPRAADPGRRWSVVIGISAPAGTTWAGAYVDSLAQALNRLCGPVEVDVFADAGTVAQLHSMRRGDLDWLHIHEPGSALAASQDRFRRLSQWRPRAMQPTADPAGPAGRAGRVWADWITAGLAGRAVRSLHVVLDGTWDADRPVLSLPADPSDPGGPDRCTYVTAEDVVRLSDALGAATLSFGSQPGGVSDAAIRAVADHLGQLRPGATLYSSITADPDGEQLASAQAFLAGRADDVPRHHSLFAYLQPEQVRPALLADWPDPAPAPTGEEPGLASPRPDPRPAPRPAVVMPGGVSPGQPVDPSEAFYTDQEQVPSWVAASERYIGSQLASLSQPASTPESVPYKQAYDQGAAQALAELQAMLAKHARPS